MVEDSSTTRRFLLWMVPMLEFYCLQAYLHEVELLSKCSLCFNLLHSYAVPFFVSFAVEMRADNWSSHCADVLATRQKAARSLSAPRG